jgi:type IV pilus assembly protein PilA
MLKTLKKRMNNQRGLTLVELLAVIVILGIISAIAVPSIGGIIDKSKKDAQVAEAIQIISAAKLAHASDSEIITWKYEKTATDTTSVGELKSYLSSSVADKEFTVTYVDNTYKIVGHEAAQQIVSSNVSTTPITETQLTDKAK